MALHHDIYWVGKQWAVTGYGIQACNQKQRGKFDIEGARLWEDGVLESLRAEKWLDAGDLDKALDVARKYYPEPERKAAASKAKATRGKAVSATENTPKEDGTPQAGTPIATAAIATALKAGAPKAGVANASAPVEPKAAAKQLPDEPSKPMAQKFDKQINRGSAKFVRVWRVRIQPGRR